MWEDWREWFCWSVKTKNVLIIYQKLNKSKKVLTFKNGAREVRKIMNGSFDKLLKIKIKIALAFTLGT